MKWSSYYGIHLRQRAEREIGEQIGLISYMVQLKDATAFSCSPFLRFGNLEGGCFSFLLGENRVREKTVSIEHPARVSDVMEKIFHVISQQ